MSGAAGHLLHLHENRSLTFNELIEALTLASEGRLEQVTEKFDGMNVVFTWDDANIDVRIARNTEDMLAGGMNMNELRERFKDRAQIRDAFIQAFIVLRQALKALPRATILQLFYSPGKRRWFSAEVVYPSGANTIDYDSNGVVFHEHPVFEVDYSGAITRVYPQTNTLDVLNSYIETMQQSIKVRGWSVMGPSVVQLQALVDKQHLDNALNTIDEALAQAGLSRSATINEYLHSMAFERGKRIGLSDSIAKKLADRLLNVKGAPNIALLVKMSPRHAQQLTSLVKQDKQLVATFLRPIELAISDLACEILKGFHSVLIKDGPDQVNKLRDRVINAIDSIKASGDIESIAKLEKQLLKLHSVDNINSAIEGIVFVFKGIAYKLTGAWAPAHQIISLYKRQNVV